MMTTDAIAQPGTSAGALLVSKPPPASEQGRPAFSLEPDGSDAAGREGGTASPSAAEASVEPVAPMGGSQLLFGELSSPEAPLLAQPPVSVRSGDPLVLPPEPAVPIGFANPPITDAPPVAIAPPSVNPPPDPAALAAQPDIGQAPPPLTGEPMGAGLRSGVVPSPQSVDETRASPVITPRSLSVTETVTGAVAPRDPLGVPTVGQPATPPTSGIREPDAQKTLPIASPSSLAATGAPVTEVSPRQKSTVADPSLPASNGQGQAANLPPKPQVSNPPTPVPATGEVPRVQSPAAPATTLVDLPIPSDEGFVSAEPLVKPAPSVTGGSALSPRVQTAVPGPAQDVLPEQTTPTKERLPQSPRATEAAPTAQVQLIAGPGEVSQPRDGMPIQTLDAPEPTGRDPITEKPGNPAATSAPSLQKGRDMPQPPQQTAARDPGEPLRAERADRRDGAPTPPASTAPLQASGAVATPPTIAPVETPGLAPLPSGEALADAPGVPRFEPEGTSLRSDPARTTSEGAARGLDTARSIQSQIVDAARQAPDGSVEIKLSPEELGRVRMTVSPGDAEVTISVMAERGETLDLLRRNADILSAELRNAGFERLSLDFGQSTGGGSDANPSSDQPGLGPPDETADTQDTPEPQAPSHPLSDTTRLDIRL